VMMIALAVMAVGCAPESGKGKGKGKGKKERDRGSDDGGSQNDVGETGAPKAGGNTESEGTPAAWRRASAFPAPPAGARDGEPPPPPADDAPAESQDAVAALIAKYGLLSIKGDAATPANLRTLDQAYERLPEGSTRDLELVFQKTDNGEVVDRAGSGVWCGVDDAGNALNPPVALDRVKHGRITYFGKTPSKWVFVHEVGHHVTLYLDPGFGRALLDAVGYQLPAGDALLAVPDDRFDKSGVPASSYPTAYAKEQGTEHAAELFTEHLAHDFAPGATRFLRGFKLPAKAGELLESKLGPRRGDR
jgi:hypothetical protein